MKIGGKYRKVFPLLRYAIKSVGFVVDRYDFKYEFLEYLVPAIVRVINFGCFFWFVIPHVSKI